MLRIYCLSLLLALAACTGTETPENSVFAPKEVEFSVTFPGEPKLSEVTGKGGWFAEPTTLQVATRGNRELFLKAEAVKVDRRALGELSHERLIAYGMSYAENQGFEAVEVTAEVKPFGPCHTVRGRKRMEGLPYVFLVRTCFGSTSMVTQYVAAPPADFPPQGGAQFLASLKAR
jgi:hypothetical protein